MPNTREKLIEQKVKIGKESICHKCIHNGICIGETNQPCIGCNRFIDSNGVTVAYNLSPTEPLTNCQQWIPVSEPPKESGLYFVTLKHWLDGKPVVREAFWNGADWLKTFKWEEITPRITHWMHMPKPPKEE